MLGWERDLGLWVHPVHRRARVTLWRKYEGAGDTSVSSQAFGVPQEEQQEELWVRLATKPDSSYK